MIKAWNKTENMFLNLKDFYLVNPGINSGYYGVIEYTVEPRRLRPRNIHSSVFGKKLLEQNRAQEIHVMHGEELLLVLHRESFENNKEVFFETGDDDEILVARFVARTETTFAQRIWGMFGFRGAGS